METKGCGGGGTGSISPMRLRGVSNGGGSGGSVSDGEDWITYEQHQRFDASSEKKELTSEELRLVQEQQPQAIALYDAGKISPS